jgi:hypothetical protein
MMEEQLDLAEALAQLHRAGPFLTPEECADALIQQLTKGTTA